MRPTKVMYYACLLLLTASCEPAVIFREPQPRGCQNEKRIPARMQGYYRSLEDSSGLIINDHMIYRVFEGDLALSVKDRDSGYFLQGDSLQDVNTGIRFPVSKNGDSLFARIVFRDTLFAMGENGLLRRFKGYCFLNRKYGEEGWEVQKISLRRGILAIGSIKESSDIQKLQAVSEAEPDTLSPHLVSPDRRTFKKFLKEGGFRDEEVFVRQPGIPHKDMQP